MLEDDRQPFYADLHTKARTLAEQASVTIHSEFCEGDVMKGLLRFAG
jgi:hypothetical protein